jgi:hypothetical protein
MMKNSKNLIKQQSSMYSNLVLCKVSTVECSYRRVNWENLIMDIIRSIYMNLHEFMYSIEAINYEKF